MHAGHIFEFIDNKNDYALDPKFLQTLVEEFGVDTFFETGTYDARTSMRASSFFKQVYTVELHKVIFDAARKKLASYNQVHLYHGHSADIIRSVCPELKGKILFWLDAHWSGKGTAMRFDDPYSSDAITAIRDELRAIKEVGCIDCVIMIDDIRTFGVVIDEKDYIGCWAYPSVQEVVRMLHEINPHFECVLLGDQLLAYDATKYHPTFSKTVHACTKTRLYDGGNLNDQELLMYEQHIQQAPDREKQFILRLYEWTTKDKDPMFWHDLWYGLVQLGNSQYAQARDAFTKVKTRKQYLTKQGQKDNTTIMYDHWRIHQYQEFCAARS